MDGLASGIPLAAAADLPPELRLRILDLLPPNDLALAGRLASKDAAQRFSQPPHRTAHLVSLPLSGHVVESTWCVEGAQAALKQLTLQQRVVFLMRSPVSGCEANVELAWRLVQPGLFPELLHTDHYLSLLDWPLEAPEMGSTAMASGLAHLLPSFEQRCPGLLEPARTLEAAARHCDLAGLQAAWELLGKRLLYALQHYVRRSSRQPCRDDWLDGVWRRLMAAAAGSHTPDAHAKMGWVLKQCWAHGDPRTSLAHVDVLAAAVASGDIARVRWLHGRSHVPNGFALMRAVLEHATLDYILWMTGEEGGCLLPPEDDPSWTHTAVAVSAARSPTDSAAKLRWLAARGADLAAEVLLFEACTVGNLEAVQLLLMHAGRDADMLRFAFDRAVTSGSIPTASALPQAGAQLERLFLSDVFGGGDLPMLRWLLQEGCSLEGVPAHSLLCRWPSDTSADSARLMEAVRLMAAAGWRPAAACEGCLSSYTQDECKKHPWSVWKELLCLPRAPAPPTAFRTDAIPRAAVSLAGASGCEEALEALATVLPPWEASSSQSYACGWYADAAKNGDLGTLTCLQRLGVPRDNSEVFDSAVRWLAPRPALEWLLGQGAPWDSQRLRGTLCMLQTNQPLGPEERGQQWEVRKWLADLLEQRADSQGRSSSLLRTAGR